MKERILIYCIFALIYGIIIYMALPFLKDIIDYCIQEEIFIQLFSFFATLILFLFSIVFIIFAYYQIESFFKEKDGEDDK